MKCSYFSGFSLQGEEALFREWIRDTPLVACGFSYGAIKLIEAILHGELGEKRIEMIQLFSPAYFVTQGEKFKRLQLLFFSKDPQGYRDNFFSNCGLSKEEQSLYEMEEPIESLRKLLYYDWDPFLLEAIRSRGIVIETYIGGEDTIIDPKAAKEFFSQFGEVYWIKKGDHTLRER